MRKLIEERASEAVMESKGEKLLAAVHFINLKDHLERLPDGPKRVGQQNRFRNCSQRYGINLGFDNY